MTISNISEPIISHSVSRTNHPALIDARSGRCITYGDLEEKIIKTVFLLDKFGIKRKSIVGLALSDSIEHVVLQLALARLGAIHLPIDWRWSNKEVELVGREFKPNIIITETKKDNRYIDNEHNVTKFFEKIPLSELDKFKLSFKPNFNPSHPFLISLSSGTTGTPDGPTLNHSHMISRFIAQAITLKFSWHQRFLAATPLYFGGGRTFVLSLLFMGGTVIIDPPPWKPKNFITTLEKYSPDLTFLVPTQIRDLLNLDKKSLDKFFVLSTLISSGSALHKHERQKIVQKLCSGLIEYYASTEGGGITALFADEMGKAPDSVGKPIFRVEVDIVDENKNSLPTGQTGLIRYRGPAVAGDNRIKDQKRDVLLDSGEWFYPGDLGEIDDAGFLYLRGRAKDMIIRGGVNIYPQEIERVISQIRGIKEVCVFGLPDNHFGEIVVAAIICDNEINEELVRAQCVEFLAPYKVPSQFISLDHLPKNSGGKIQKEKVKNLVIDRKGNETI